MMVAPTLFSLSVKKYLESILKMCSIFVLFHYREEIAFPTVKSIEMIEKLYFNMEYSVNDAFQELKNWCTEEKYCLLHLKTTFCFPSMNNLPKPLCKIVWFEYVKREFEIHFIQTFTTNTYGLASIEHLDTDFLKKFHGSPKLLSFLQCIQNEIIFYWECENLRNRFYDYFNQDYHDEHNIDSDSDLDDYHPYEIEYVDEENVDIYL